MTRQSGAFIGLTAIVSFLLGLVVAGTRPPLARGVATIHPPVVTAPLVVEHQTVSDATMPAAVTAVDFAAVAARINTSVVNVDTASRGDDRPRPSRRYSADDPSAPRESSGSGFIIDAAGFILTNQHVVSGADRVTVTLADGRSFRAEVIGTDPAIDVALLQVHARDPLPVAVLGSSDSLRVGQWVCAIGNPLGVYVHSVTVGVVSFLGRQLRDQSLASYIQTDAAISFGNSGGPLINGRGEVVGITTAISAEAVNVGFAIPIDQVTAVLAQLRERGTVTRGYLDMGLATLTPSMRRALKVGPDYGAVVQDVPADTQAERSGLRTYDLVTGVNGRSLRSADDLVRYAAEQAPGSVAVLEVWRDGSVRHVSIKLGVRRVPETGRRQTFRSSDARTISQNQPPLGIAVRDLDPDIAADLRIPDTVQGVLVSEVDTAGPAHLAQVRASNIILEINRHPVRSEAEYRSVLSSLTAGEPVALLLYDKYTGTRVLRTVMTDTQP
ncbi:MAG: trypsin-like peptidase domain-containing protein [Acidobacteriota bacterium]